MRPGLLHTAFDNARKTVIGSIRWKFGSSTGYWEERVRRLGQRAVFNRGHPKETTDIVADELRALLLPLLSGCLNGTERMLLDFGCGYGRFTADFASAIGGEAIGVDPVPGLIERAVSDEHTEFRLLADGRIPMPDQSAHVITIVQVMCNITRPREVAATVAEVRRVLAPEGLVFLVDNTTSGRRQQHHVRLRSEAEYIKLFSFANMRRVGGYEDLGEQFSVLAGRRR